MTKRVLGVLAALTMGVSALACSSSSAGPVGGTPDTGKPADGGTDTKPGTDAKTDTTPPAKVWPKTGMTGKACTNSEECDPDLTAEGFAICAAYINADPICVMSSESEDACDMGDGKTIPFCDGTLGLCTKSGMNPASCDAKCEIGADGMWMTQCLGKNACGLQLTGKDDTGKVALIGTCSGGCQTNTDCKTTGAKCDPVLNYCLPGCATDADCKAYGVTSPLWKCETTNKVCTWVFPKKLGETCATQDECICMMNTGDTAGACTQYCKTGGTTCGMGYTCDTLLNKADTMGAPIVTWTTNPAGLSGYCLKNCTADTDCVTGQVCDNSGGMTQKTCRPKATP